MSRNQTSKYQVEIFRSIRKQILSDKRIHEIVSFTLESQKVRSAYVDIAIVGDRLMHKLTEEYTGHRYRTDVLSFELTETGDEYQLSCQIIVNGQLAQSEAKKSGASPSAELAMYLIHGLLHLLGFDDKTPKQATEMHQKTFYLLKRLNFKKLPPLPKI